ncbi:MAG TPA: hypothetical protein PKG82_02525 [Myxococcota bacterium]|nr:hypothetical protein [Myxococcota bacterium]
MSRQTEDTMKPAGLESPPSSGTLASARKVVVPVPEPVAPDGPVVLPLIPDENLGLLPSSYDMDRLYAVPRDPERVFATFGISRATMARAGSADIAIRFVFEDGVNSSDFIDVIPPGSSVYYCAVPPGRLWFTVELGFLDRGRFEGFLSFGPVPTAVAFVRPGTPEFVRFDPDAPPGPGWLAAGMTAVPAPDLPGPAFNAANVEAGLVQRNWIGYMPVSGRK